MSPLRLAPLAAAEAAAALDLLDAAFADDPTLAWYLFAQRPGFAARRRAYLQHYLDFHRHNALPILGAWSEAGLAGVCLFSGAADQPQAGSLNRLGRAIQDSCGAACCLERLDELLAAVERAFPAPCARIEFIGVAPAQQGLGIGGQLLAASLEQLSGDGRSPAVLLETGAPRNLPLYRRHGFVERQRLALSGLEHYLLQRVLP